MTEEQPKGVGGAPQDLEDATVAARARALSSPVRWRVLRACLDQALTNKELADLLGINPGSMLHHVRTLVGTDFLVAEEPRRGARNAVEIPYRTTDLVWSVGRSAAGLGDFLMEEVETAQAHDGANAWRTIIRVDDAARAGLQERLEALLEEYRAQGEELPEEEGRHWSVVVALRPQPS